MVPGDPVLDERLFHQAAEGKDHVEATHERPAQPPGSDLGTPHRVDRAGDLLQQRCGQPVFAAPVRRVVQMEQVDSVRPQETASPGDAPGDGHEGPQLPTGESRALFLTHVVPCVHLQAFGPEVLRPAIVLIEQHHRLVFRRKARDEINQDLVRSAHRPVLVALDIEYALHPQLL